MAPRQVSAPQVGTREVRASQVAVADHDVAKVHADEVGAAKEGAMLGVLAVELEALALP